MEFNYISNEKNENKDKNIEIDQYEENEEEEINSDEYVSSSMLDVDTNTYINQTLINTSNIKLINEKELKTKKNEKERKIINIYSKKENNQIINKNEKDLAVLTINQNNMIPLQQFFDHKNKPKKIISNKYKGKNNDDKNRKKNTEINDVNININANILKNKTNNSKDKDNISNKKKSLELKKGFVNENTLKNILILKKGKNYKILKNSKSINMENAKGRLSTSPKIESFTKNSNQSNINLDILRNLKKNYSNNIIDNYIKINPCSKIYIKKIAKNTNNRDPNSPLSLIKINSPINANNKKVDFLKNTKINEEMFEYIQNKKNLNSKELFGGFGKDKIENNNNISKSKSKGKEKNNIVRIKSKINNNLDEKYKKIISKDRPKTLRCFISFCYKNKENKILKNININSDHKSNDIINTINRKSRKNNTNNNSELFNKSLDAKKKYEISKKYKFKIKQRRNLSTDIDYISNNIPYKINIIQNQNELKNHNLFNYIKNKEAFSYRSQYKGFNNLKNNSKFNLRNKLLFDISKKNKINEITNDNTLILKANKSIDRTNIKNKYDIKYLFENNHMRNSNKKMNKESIYKKIMKNFYKNGKNSLNAKYQNKNEKNNRTRRTEYKQNNSNINYNINNSINNNINNININASNNLINLITNITTTNDEFQSLSSKKTYVRHNLTNSLIQNRKMKKEIDSNIIDNIVRLSEVNNTHFNKNHYIDRNNNVKKKSLNNNYKIDKKITYAFPTQNNNRNIILPNSFLQNNNCRKDIKKYIIDTNISNKRFMITSINSERNNYKAKFNTIKNNNDIKKKRKDNI